MIRQFIEDNFLFREEGKTIADHESLMEAGIMDSTGTLELLAFLESKFHLVVADAEVIPENLDSIERIDAYVASKVDERATV